MKQKIICCFSLIVVALLTTFLCLPPKDADILKGYKDGYFVFYQINNEVFNECITFMKTLGSESSYTFLEKEKISNINRCHNTCKGTQKCCRKREE